MRLFTDSPQVRLREGKGVDLSRVKEGDDVYFECQVSANPTVSEIIWYKEVSTNFHFSYLEN